MLRGNEMQCALQQLLLYEHANAIAVQGDFQIVSFAVSLPTITNLVPSGMCGGLDDIACCVEDGAYDCYCESRCLDGNNCKPKCLHAQVIYG